MKNIITLNTIKCECSGILTTDTGTSEIVINIVTGNVTEPKLEIYTGDTLMNTVDLVANSENIIPLEREYWTLNGYTQLRYTDIDGAHEYVKFVFPAKINDIVIFYDDIIFTVVSKNESGGSYTLPVATADTLGGVMVGDNLTIDEIGKLSATANPYTLPPATPESLGGIIVGDNLAITSDGKLSATNTQMFNYSTEEQVIGAWIDGKPIYQRTFIISDFDFSYNKDFTNDLFVDIKYIFGAEMYDTTSSTVRFVNADARKISSNVIRLYNTSNWGSIDAYTLRYTKTSDY